MGQGWPISNREGKQLSRGEFWPWKGFMKIACEVRFLGGYMPTSASSRVTKLEGGQEALPLICYGTLITSCLGPSTL